MGASDLTGPTGDAAPVATASPGADSPASRAPDSETTFLDLLRQALAVKTQGGASGTDRPATEDAWADPEMVLRIGRYEILGELGQGGFGTVLRVRDPSLLVERAMKVP